MRQKTILVTRALVIISNKVKGSVVKERAQLLGLGLGERAGDLSGHFDFTNGRHCYGKELDVMSFESVEVELSMLQKREFAR